MLAGACVVSFEMEEGEAPRCVGVASLPPEYIRAIWATRNSSMLAVGGVYRSQDGEERVELLTAPLRCLSGGELVHWRRVHRRGLHDSALLVL